MQQVERLGKPETKFRQKPLTPFQERTLNALDRADFGGTHVLDAPETVGVGFGRVLLFGTGVFAMLVGVTLIFFLTAVGSLLFAAGGVACVVAYEAGGKQAEGLPVQARLTEEADVANLPAHTPLH